MNDRPKQNDLVSIIDIKYKWMENLCSLDLYKGHMQPEMPRKIQRVASFWHDSIDLLQIVRIINVLLLQKNVN